MPSIMISNSMKSLTFNGLGLYQRYAIEVLSEVRIGGKAGYAVSGEDERR